MSRWHNRGQKSLAYTEIAKWNTIWLVILTFRPVLWFLGVYNGKMRYTTLDSSRLHRLYPPLLKGLTVFCIKFYLYFWNELGTLNLHIGHESLKLIVTVNSCMWNYKNGDH